MRVNRIVQLVILGMLSLPLHGDDCLGTYRRLTAECYAYIKFFETNCANELQQLLADTNAVSPRIVQRQDVSGVGKSIGGAVATNAVFAVRRHRGGWHFSYITASYADGTQLQINLSKRGITQLHWTMGSRRGQSFEIQAGEEGQEKILCYDVERVGEGDDEDLYLSNIRHYEGSRLVREDPPNRLGEMIFENKASRLHQPSSSATNLLCAADLKQYFRQVYVSSSNVMLRFHNQGMRYKVAIGDDEPRIGKYGETIYLSTNQSMRVVGRGTALELKGFSDEEDVGFLVTSKIDLRSSGGGLIVKRARWIISSKKRKIKNDEGHFEAPERR